MLPPALNMAASMQKGFARRIRFIFMLFLFNFANSVDWSSENDGKPLDDEHSDTAVSMDTSDTAMIIENSKSQDLESSDNSKKLDIADNDGVSSNMLSTFQQSFYNLTKLALDNLSSYKEYLLDLLQDLQNSSTTENKVLSSNNSSEEVNSLNDTTLNSTESSDNITYTEIRQNRKRFVCHSRNLTVDNLTIAVQLVNGSLLQEKLLVKNATVGDCFVVMFYAPWCEFCAETAPAYNALARGFPQLEFYAIDAVYFSSLNARFGTIAVPNIVLFHNGRRVNRYNRTERTLENLVSYLANVTGFKPSEVNITEADYEGPLPSKPTDETNYVLILAWTFIILYSCIMVAKSNSGMQLWHKIQLLWQEHQHQHID